MTKNIMIVGVGGQGTLLTSRILGGITLGAGYDVKLSEVHGMAQRGGSVVTFVRYGENVAEPIVEEGQADVLIAFEKLEALRYAHFLKKDGALVVNEQRIEPITVVTGARSILWRIWKRNTPYTRLTLWKKPKNWAIPRCPTSLSWAWRQSTWISPKRRGLR